jgi:hypothetical protein
VPSALAQQQPETAPHTESEAYQSPTSQPQPDPFEAAPHALSNSLPGHGAPKVPKGKVIPEDEPPTANASIQAPAAPAPTDAPSPELEQPALLDEPRAALTAFLKAANWRERQSHTQHGTALRSDMEKYYADHADGPIATDSVDYLTSQPTPDGKGRFHLFQVAITDGLGFPVSVESVDGKFKVDWTSFVEFKDRMLPKYFEKFSSEPATFHAVLHRSHYFGTDVPNQENKICFAVEPPITGYTNYVWVDKNDTSLISKLAERGEFGFVSYPVISIRWVKEKKGDAYVTLSQIIADNWRADSSIAALK